jgi:hypothetical protein
MLDLACEHGYQVCAFCGGSYRSSYVPSSGSGASYTRSGGRSARGRSRPRWAKAGPVLPYAQLQVQSLEPIRQSVEKQAVVQPDLRDCFLCHAWDDRQGSAKELHDLLVVGWCQGVERDSSR